MKKILFLFSVLLACIMSAQVITDTIFGKLKFVKEYVVFLTKTENVKLLPFEGDYGHDGFQSPSLNRKKFNYWWFEDVGTHYVNTERIYNLSGQIATEKWFRKNSKLFREFQYQFNKNNLLDTKVKITPTIGTHKTKFYYFNNQLISRREFIDNTFPKEMSLFLENFDRNDMDSAFFDKERNRLYFEKSLNNEPFISEYDHKNREAKIYRLTNKKYSVQKYGDSTIYQIINDTIYSKVLVEERRFDASNNMTGQKLFSQDYDKNELYLEHRFHYDNKSRLIETQNFQDGKMTSFFKYWYDHSDLLIQRENYFSGELTTRKEFQYHQNYLKKLIITNYSKATKSPDEYLIEFKYKFDKQKNWTEITKNVNGKDLYIWKREIEYY